MRIAEVSKQFGISADTLRYYERIGLLSHVQRNESGIRDYGEQDLARIRFVKCMRGANVSIEALIEYMELFEGGDATLRARKAILEKEREKVRERMAEMQAGLDRLDYKIAHYEDLIVKAEQKMARAPEWGQGFLPAVFLCLYQLVTPRHALAEAGAHLCRMGAARRRKRRRLPIPPEATPLRAAV